MTSIHTDDAQNGEWADRQFWGRPDPERNVGFAERWVSGAVGVGLLAHGLGRQRGRLVLVPIGLGLLRRAITGRCEVKRALGSLRSRGPGRPGSVPALTGGAGRKIEQAVTIDRPPAELFHFWRRFDNLPRFMDNLESVTMLDNCRSRWVAKGPLGIRVGWEAEIHHEVEDELIGWRSLPGADVDQAGSVHFAPEPGGGTEVRVRLRYAAPAGALGDALAQVLGDDPEHQIADDLRRLKQVMEAGEVATSPLAEGTR
ncbi:MAG: SRPBCC family protein [Gemmatimonadales bacterium]